LSEFNFTLDLVSNNWWIDECSGFCNSIS